MGLRLRCVLTVSVTRRNLHIEGWTRSGHAGHGNGKWRRVGKGYASGITFGVPFEWTLSNEQHGGLAVSDLILLARCNTAPLPSADALHCYPRYFRQEPKKET